MIADVLFAILRGFLSLLSRLPLGVLYLLSDCVFVLIFYVVRYRRKVVRDNLSKCFPDFSPGELRRTERQFYRNFADYIFETVKLLHISDAEIERRMTFENVALMQKYIDEGRSIVVYFSHCGNWEWAPSVTLHTERPDAVYGQVYRPLKDKHFDALMLKVRSRFGSLNYPKSQVLRDLILARRQGKVTVTGFMSDQKPSHGDPTYVTLFLNRPTAFISGTETLARKLGMAAIYWDISKTGRGCYRISCRDLAANVADTEPGEVTGKYASMLEQTIRRNPSVWLWTHKKWKNPVTLPENYGKN